MTVLSGKGHWAMELGTYPWNLRARRLVLIINNLSLTITADVIVSRHVPVTNIKFDELLRRRFEGRHQLYYGRTTLIDRVRELRSHYMEGIELRTVANVHMAHAAKWITTSMSLKKLTWWCGWSRSRGSRPRGFTRLMINVIPLSILRSSLLPTCPR